MKSFDGQKLRALMRKKGVTYRDLSMAAEKLGLKLSRSTIYYHMEPGADPGCRYLAFYAHAFQANMEELFKGEFKR